MMIIFEQLILPVFRELVHCLRYVHAPHDIAETTVTTFSPVTRKRLAQS